MSNPDHNNLEKIAESMGISLYQRFTPTEASLFLRCPLDEIKKLQNQGHIDFIHITDTQTEFFGYQLLAYLLNNVTNNTSTPTQVLNTTNRIIRAKEVQEMTGLSRTTIWRMERKGEFPDRVTLGAGSVGWKLSEVNDWVNNR